MSIEELHVLVVEDHEFRRRIACNLLRQLGVASVIEAADGREALDRIQSAAVPIDVALVNLRMPNMDGIEFLRAIARDKLAASVVLISSLDPSLLASVEMLGREHDVRLLGSISKPLTPQKLQNVLDRYDLRETRRSINEARWVPTAPELANALDSGALTVYYQPQVEFATLQVTCMEALVRWTHPARGLLLPDTFLQLAQEHGLMQRLHEFVMQRALTDLAQWRRYNLQCGVAVNIASSVLRQSSTADRIAELTAKHGCQSVDVHIEVTESSAATDEISVVENLLRLRLKGFGLALDDYGTGYATMQQINRLPLTHLKIDRSFINEAGRRPKLRTLLDSSLQLAHKLGLQSVGEGVETEEEWELLRGLGCNIAQGYLVSKPMPSDQVPEWHHNWVQSAK